MPHVCVIIPYYQKKPGILSRAVRSVNVQSYTGSVDLCIVDDGSPVSAATELAEVSLNPNINLEIILQENGGPARARNTGLEYARHREATFVAFLDSDDEWQPMHLANACQALGPDNDFYFADFRQPDGKQSVFSKGGFPSAEVAEKLEQSSCLYLYRGDFYDQIICDYVLGTSTIVYRFEKYTELRFDETFVNAGEDHLFWLDIAKEQPHVCFSAEIEALYGRGVNVWASGVWGSDNYLNVLYYSVKFNNKLISDYPLSQTQRDTVVGRRRKQLYSVFLDYCNRIGHRKKLNWRLSRALVRENKLFISHLPYYSVRMVYERLRRRISAGKD